MTLHSIFQGQILGVYFFGEMLFCLIELGVLSTM